MSEDTLIPEITAAEALIAASHAIPALQKTVALMPNRDRLLVRACLRACETGNLFVERARSDLAVLLDRLDEEIEADTVWRPVAVEVGAIGDEPIYDGVLRPHRGARAICLDTCRGQLAEVMQAVVRTHALVEAERRVAALRDR
ncbi:MAG: hypothetical protein ACP5EN_09795 [Rhodovulum sp.]